MEQRWDSFFSFFSQIFLNWFFVTFEYSKPKKFQKILTLSLIRYKDDFMKLLSERAPSFGVKNLKIISFAAQRGYNPKYTATDLCVAVNALLELSGRKEPEQNFHEGKFTFDFTTWRTFFHKLFCTNKIWNFFYSSRSPPCGASPEHTRSPEGSRTWQEAAPCGDEHN